MEGGGAKGIGLLGALSVLYEAGWRARRVAGTSSGGIVGAMLASGMSIDEMHLRIAGLNYRKLRDTGPAWKFGPLGGLLSLATRKGVYEGKYIERMLEQSLAAVGVSTFADLYMDEPWAKKLPPERRYKLVVVAADVTNGRMVRFPWDYHAYGLKPDDQKVASAVRASLAIPFFYTPAKLKGHLLVDGSILSRFPIDLFDETPDCPTIGIKLSAKSGDKRGGAKRLNTVEYTQSVLLTMLGGRDQMNIDDKPQGSRVIYVDTEEVGITDFDVNVRQLERIYVSGRQAATNFLKSHYP